MSTLNKNKMKIEIWSDVVCPFCYIGKRKFEKALDGFPHKDEVEITWKSFQLSPESKYKEGQTLYGSLAESKGWTEEYAKDVTKQVVDMAKQEGLDFNFDKAVPANTFNAHRLIHLAAKHGLQDQTKERLLKAFFIEGKNVEDNATLTQLGTALGLPEQEIEALFSSNEYAGEVNHDMDEARQIGVRGVPFFVVDRKYAVSGAQPSDVFLKTLEKAWEEKEPSLLAENNGASCDVDGNCE